MPKAAIETSRVQTWSTNVNKHPRAEAQAALRAHKPRRAPEVVQREKDEQKAKREEKAREKLEENAKQEALELELEEYRAQQEVDVENEVTAFPCQQPRGYSKPIAGKVKIKLAPSSLSDLQEQEIAEVPNRHPTTSTNVGESKDLTNVGNKANKRKNVGHTEAMALANSSKEIVAPAKKTRINPPQTTTSTNINNRANKHKNIPHTEATTPASDSEEIVVPAKKTRHPVPCPTWKKGTSTQASITSETLLSNVTMTAMMPDKDESQGHPRLPMRKCSSYDDNDIADVENLNDLVTPVCPSKKIKTDKGAGLNKPQPLQHTDSGEEKTLQPGDFQQSQNTIADTDNEDIEPFETPPALKKAKKQAAPVSEIEETSEIEGVEMKWVGTDERKNKGSAVDKTTSWKPSTTGTQASNTSHPAPAPTSHALSLAVTHSAPKSKEAARPRTTALNNTQIKATRTKKEKEAYLTRLPKEAEPLFSTIALPTFIGKFFADGNGWETPSKTYIPILQDICDHATQTQLWDYHSQMKSRALQAIKDAFILEYGGEALKDERKRMEFGKFLCTKGEHNFTFKIINQNGKRKAQFKNKMIIETMSVHYTFATLKKKLPNFEIGEPEVALALATAAVERALVLWRDNHLEYERGTVKHHRTSSAQDFSSTNYRSSTLGWLERIREKHKKDANFFAKVCEQACELCHLTGKNKLSVSHQYSDCEIEERAGVMSDDSDQEECTTAARGNEGGNDESGNDESDTDVQTRDPDGDESDNDKGMYADYSNDEAGDAAGHIY
ncbi:hypothetical protein BYT27DRAFT_7213102 [Phlegmacium glaucopus]|nr:hypothetical protein BYT27DRAFT_7213102 [Phlegmacium glaucopus]